MSSIFFASLYLALGFALIMPLVSCSPARWAEHLNANSPVAPDPNATQNRLPSDPSPSPLPPTLPPTVGTTPSPVPAPLPLRTYSAIVSLYHSFSYPIDIVWVIDNSPSMREDIERVRSNFKNFTDSVRTRSDLKLGLISSLDDDDTKIALPYSGENYKQINRYVWSTDSVEILAATICPETPLKESMCGHIRQNARTNLTSVADTMFRFLRPTSKKVFVFVTDDESRVAGPSFLTAFNEVYPTQTPVIYGFIGLGDEQSPCAAKPGHQYSDLAQLTGGAVYNICNRNWQDSFSELAKGVIKWTAMPVPVPSDLKDGSAIHSIEINGELLNPSQYTLTPEGLIFHLQEGETHPDAQMKIVYEIQSQVKADSVLIQ
jgi:hypothetical protein